MTAIAMTIIICVTIVTLYAMKCSNARIMKTEQTVLQEITKSIMERVKDNVQ